MCQYYFSDIGRGNHEWTRMDH